MIFMIYGAGSPLRMESYSPEVAEAEAVERFGLKIENLVTKRNKYLEFLDGYDDAEMAPDDAPYLSEEEV